MFENAKWIARKDSMDIEPAPLFRKRFAITKTVKSAKMYVCGLGHGIYYLNGEKITDQVLLTPISKYDTRIYYDTFTVTHLLRPGENTIGCMLGNGWYFVTYHRWDFYKPDWLHHPKMILKLKIIYTDDTVDEIVSDTTWKTHDSALLYNENKRGEIYDARYEITDWCKSTFDDDLWENAFICRSPGGKLYKNMIPPIRVIRQLEAKHLNHNVYDIGQNISGWVKILVQGERGARVQISYAERLHMDGTIAPEYLNTIVGSETHQDTYILKGDGIEEWSPRFVYHGFRYVDVKIEGTIDIFELCGEVVHTDLKQIGEFTCNDEMLNQIHSATKWSTLTNAHGIPTDCPQREQNGWTGDALVSAEQMLMSFDAVSFYKKWLMDICDTQRPSGQICCMAPTSGWGYNWGSGPAWDSVLILLPYYIYYYTGDKSTIRKFWKNMNLYMEYMESMSESNTVNFGLGDWCAPVGVETCPVILTDTAFFYNNYVVMGKCAKILGIPHEKYTKRAEEIKTEFRKQFIDKSFYCNDNMTAIACSIYYDLYMPEEKHLASEHLAELVTNKNFHTECGIIGMKCIFSALSEYGYADTAYQMTVNPEMPSYAYWILNGMTTLCETWEMNASCNHHMFSEVNMWLYKHVAGIQIDEGAQTVTIKPCYIKKLKWVKASYKNVSVFWDEHILKVKTELPATVILGQKTIKIRKGESVFYR